MVTINGTGFCARSGCAPVRLSIAGRQFGRDQVPDSSGRFRSVSQAPGGLVSGSHEVVATQVLDDGNQDRASALFTYSPSKGEAAEREAENRDAVVAFINPSAPAVPTRGVPFASAAGSEAASIPAPDAASATTEPEAASSARELAADAEPAKRSRRLFGWPALFALAVGLAVAGLVTTSKQRAHRGRHAS
jgi:hypothetical protein